MKQLELVISTDSGVKKIDANFEQLEQQLDCILKNYNGVMYAENTLTLAKEDRAYLRKAAKEIDARRLEYSREFKKPLVEFESKIKVLVNKLLSTANEIDKQVIEFETKEKAVKLDLVKKIIASLNDVEMPFEMLYEERFLNKTVSEKQVAEVVEQKLEKAREDLEIIKMNEPTDLQDAINYYYKNQGGLSATLIEIKRIKEIAEKVAEVATQKAVENIAVEELKEQKLFTADNTEEEMEEFTLSIFATKSQFEKVKEFLKTHNIKTI